MITIIRRVFQPLQGLLKKLPYNSAFWDPYGIALSIIGGLFWVFTFILVNLYYVTVPLVLWVHTLSMLLVLVVDIYSKPKVDWAYRISEVILFVASFYAQFFRF